MPYSPELGMRVYDPREASQEGAQAGALFAQSMQAAQNRALQGRSLDLDERKMRMMEDEVAQKAKVTLRRQIGMQQMQSRAAELAQHMPQELATKQAFLENMPLIYGDTHPEEIGKVVMSEEAHSVKQEAQRQLNLRASEALDLKAQIANQSAELTGNKNQIQLQNSIIRQNQEERQLAETHEFHQANATNQQEMRDLRKDTLAETERKNRADEIQKLRTDPVYAEVNDALETQNKLLTALNAGSRWHPFTKKADVESSIKALEAQKLKILKEHHLVDEDQPATEPVPARRLKFTPGAGFKPAE